MQLVNGPTRYKQTEQYLELLARFTVINRLKDSKSKFRELIYSLSVLQFERGDKIYNKATDDRSFGLILRGSVSLYGYEHAGMKDTE